MLNFFNNEPENSFAFLEQSNLLKMLQKPRENEEIAKSPKKNSFDLNTFFKTLTGLNKNERSKTLIEDFDFINQLNLIIWLKDRNIRRGEGTIETQYTKDIFISLRACLHYLESLKDKGIPIKIIDEYSRQVIKSAYNKHYVLVYALLCNRENVDSIMGRKVGLIIREVDSLQDKILKSKILEKVDSTILKRALDYWENPPSNALSIPMNQSAHEFRLHIGLDSRNPVSFKG